MLSGIPKHVKAVMGSTENTCYISLVQNELIMLLAMSALLMNQQYTLNKMSSNS